MSPNRLDERSPAEEAQDGGAIMLGYVLGISMIGIPVAFFYWGAFGGYTLIPRIALVYVFSLATAIYVLVGIRGWVCFLGELSRYARKTHK